MMKQLDDSSEGVNHTQTMRFHPFVFTGKERDEETGYGYFGARYMDHDLMTLWLSVDPMADRYPNISPYAYCAWNPVKLVDPDGMDALDDWYINANGEVKWSADVHSKDDLKKGEIYLGRTATMTSLNGDIVYYGDSEGKIHDATTLRDVSITTERTDHEKTMANPIVQSIHQSSKVFWGTAMNIGLETCEQTFSMCGLGLQTTGFYLMVVPGGQPIGANMYSIGNVLSYIGLGFSLLNDVRYKDWGGVAIDIVSFSTVKGTQRLINKGISSGSLTFSQNELNILKSHISTRTGLITETVKKGYK